MIECCTNAVNSVPTWVLMVSLIERIEGGNALNFIEPEVVDNLRCLLASFGKSALVTDRSDVQCVRCGREGHSSDACNWEL